LAGDTFVEPVAWHASLPGVVAAAAALIHDTAGNVLVVKPNYRDHWTLPGGICEFGEPPHVACAREVAEEIGIRIPVGRLLSVDWQLPLPAYGPEARPGVYFIFDGGTLRGLSGIRLQADELDDCMFAAQEALADLLAPIALPRACAAITARASGCVRYVPQSDGDGDGAARPAVS
jgi:8-oxo-dGTP pyrophosphatase MutT (NUDIX family)